MMDFTLRLILHVQLYVYFLFYFIVMLICIVQRIDMDFMSMR